MQPDGGYTPLTPEEEEAARLAREEAAADAAQAAAYETSAPTDPEVVPVAAPPPEDTGAALSMGVPAADPVATYEPQDPAAGPPPQPTYIPTDSPYQATDPAPAATPTVAEPTQYVPGPITTYDEQAADARQYGAFRPGNYPQPPDGVAPTYDEQAADARQFGAFPPGNYPQPPDGTPPTYDEQAANARQYGAFRPGNYPQPEDGTPSPLRATTSEGRFHTGESMGMGVHASDPASMYAARDVGHGTQVLPTNPPGYSGLTDPDLALLRIGLGIDKAPETTPIHDPHRVELWDVAADAPGGVVADAAASQFEARLAAERRLASIQRALNESDPLPGMKPSPPSAGSFDAMAEAAGQTPASRPAATDTADSFWGDPRGYPGYRSAQPVPAPPTTAAPFGAADAQLDAMLSTRPYVPEPPPASRPAPAPPRTPTQGGSVRTRVTRPAPAPEPSAPSLTNPATWERAVAAQDEQIATYRAMSPDERASEAAGAKFRSQRSPAPPRGTTSNVNAEAPAVPNEAVPAPPRGTTGSVNAEAPAVPSEPIPEAPGETTGSVNARRGFPAKKAALLAGLGGAGLGAAYLVNNPPAASENALRTDPVNANPGQPNLGVGGWEDLGFAANHGDRRIRILASLPSDKLTAASPTKDDVVLDVIDGKSIYRLKDGTPVGYANQQGGVTWKGSEVSGPAFRDAVATEGVNIDGSTPGTNTKNGTLEPGESSDRHPRPATTSDGEVIGEDTANTTKTSSQDTQSDKTATETPSTKSAANSSTTTEYQSGESTGGGSSKSYDSYDSGYQPRTSRPRSSTQAKGYDDGSDLNMDDFVKDYDGDGKITSKDRAEGKKRFNLARKKRGKKSFSSGSTSSPMSNVPYRPDSPIRTHVLQAIADSKAGR